jgi:hypothetical protein
MAQPVSVLVKIVGTEKKTSNKNPVAPKNFWITSAYVDAPGMLFPQATEIFVGDAENILAPGDYTVPLKFPVKDNRLSVELDFSAARPVSKAA